MNFHNYMIYLLKLILQKKDFKYFTKQELFIYLSKKNNYSYFLVSNDIIVV